MDGLDPFLVVEVVHDDVALEVQVHGATPFTFPPTIVD